MTRLLGLYELPATLFCCQSYWQKIVGKMILDFSCVFYEQNRFYCVKNNCGYFFYRLYWHFKLIYRITLLRDPLIHVPLAISEHRT